MLRFLETWRRCYPFLETLHLLFVPLNDFFRALDERIDLWLEAVGEFRLVLLQQRIGQEKVELWKAVSASDFVTFDASGLHVRSRVPCSDVGDRRRPAEGWRCMLRRSLRILR